MPLAQLGDRLNWIGFAAFADSRGIGLPIGVQHQITGFSQPLILGNAKGKLSPAFALSSLRIT
jgi:hypothetical protein